MRAERGQRGRGADTENREKRKPENAERAGLAVGSFNPSSHLEHLAQLRLLARSLRAGQWNCLCANTEPRCSGRSCGRRGGCSHGNKMRGGGLFLENRNTCFGSQFQSFLLLISWPRGPVMRLPNQYGRGKGSPQDSQGGSVEVG